MLLRLNVEMIQDGQNYFTFHLNNAASCTTERVSKIVSAVCVRCT